MLVEKQSELMSDLLFTVHQHGGDDVTWKPPIMPLSDITLKPRFFLRTTSHSYLYYVAKVAFDYWMVQRTSLMKPWGAEVPDKVHKSFTLCLFDQSWNHKTKNKLYYK